MSKKKSTAIDQYKDQDLQLGRDKLLGIIESVTKSASDVKNLIEAIKLLARMHKSLSPEKITQASASATAQQVQILTPEEQERIDKVLHDLQRALPSETM